MSLQERESMRAEGERQRAAADPLRSSRSGQATTRGRMGSMRSGSGWSSCSSWVLFLRTTATSSSHCLANPAGRRLPMACNCSPCALPHHRTPVRSSAPPTACAATRPTRTRWKRLCPAASAIPRICPTRAPCRSAQLVSGLVVSAIEPITCRASCRVGGEGNAEIDRQVWASGCRTRVFMVSLGVPRSDPGCRRRSRIAPMMGRH